MDGVAGFDVIILFFEWELYTLYTLKWSIRTSCRLLSRPRMAYTSGERRLLCRSSPSFSSLPGFIQGCYMLNRRPTLDDCRCSSVLYSPRRLTNQCRHRCRNYGRQYRSWHVDRHRYVPWHGFTHMAIHARVEFRVLPLARHIIAVLHSRPRWFKSALILLYLQTFGLVSRRFRIACYLTLFYTVGYLTANLLTEFLGCWPIAKKCGNPTYPGHCINRTAANTSFGIGHVTSDLIIAILPLPPIWNLTFPTTRQKIGLSLTLSSGFLFVVS